MIDVERNELLRQFAYAHWKSRGRPLNSREVDWAYALIRLEEFQEGTALSAWLFTILRNRYCSELRHRKFEASDTEGYAEDMAVDGDQEASLQLRELRKALQHLPVEQRGALILVGGGPELRACRADLRLCSGHAEEPHSACARQTRGGNRQ